MPPSPTSTQFRALVTRAACSGGKTGHVLSPVVEDGAASIVITFRAEPLPPGFYNCPSNDEVAMQVRLARSIGSRALVDGACLYEDAYLKESASCEKDGGHRWP